MPHDPTNAERQERLRAARRKAGLIRLELWIRPEHAARVKALAKRLMDATKRPSATE